jgi:hypothetical protein
MYGIAFLALQKCFTYSRRLSSCFYLMVFRVSAVDGHSYVPWKLSMNMAQIWSQFLIVPSGRLMNQDPVVLDNVVGRYLAFTRPSHPAASMTMS